MNPAAAAAAAAAGSDTDTTDSDTGSLPPSPPLHVSNAVTLAADSAAPPPPQTLTLALPVQTKPNRDDCWSDGATSALIDAWGERFIDGQIKQKQWQEVADAVSSRNDYTKTPKSDHQCKNRIDTLKKKYKNEAAKLASGAAARSTWPYFPRLDILLGSASNVSKLPPPDSDSSDDSPPEPVNGRPMTGTQEVMRSIMRFGEVYERVECSKLRQEMQMEEQRLEFERELAEQRMQFFMKAHVELSEPGNQRKRERDGVSRRNGNGSSS